MSKSNYAVIEELATEFARLPVLKQMNATEIAYFLTALYQLWGEKRRGREDETDQMVNEAMEPLMQLRAITNAARAVVKFDKELKRHAFERTDLPKQDKKTQ